MSRPGRATLPPLARAAVWWRGARWYLLLPAMAGVPLGVLWWALAPGGLRTVTAEGSLAATAAQDSWFALLGAAAGGLATMSWVLTRPDHTTGREAVRLAALVAGSLLGAGLAWGIGTAAEALAAVAAGPDPSQPLRLTSAAALFVAPLAAAGVGLVESLRDVLSGSLGESRPRRGAAPGRLRRRVRSPRSSR